MSSLSVKDDQRGIVSFMVTLIMMLVISLIVIGFAQVARRNQREALDRQLSTQAYYAAESGVNDVVKAVGGGAITDIYTNNAYATNCNALPAALAGLGVQNVLNTSSTSNVKYVCLLVNARPTSINYTLVGNQKAVAVPLTLNGNLTSLRIQWDASGTLKDPTTCGSAASLPRTTSWACDYALLHVDLAQATGLGGNPAQRISDNTVSFYLRPATSGATPTSTVSTFDFATAPTERARMAAVACNTTTGTCTANLTFSGGASGAQYYLRISSLYNDASNVRISGNVNGATVATFSNAQLAVDSTGKAEDQLRRIAVRLPARSSNLPANALQTNAILCKTFTTGTNLPTPSPTVVGANGLCP